MSRPGLLASVVAASLGGATARADTKQDESLDETPPSAAEADEEQPKNEKSTWNEYDGRFFTLRVGAGLLIDYAAFSQDAASKEQMDLENAFKLRDFRILFNGRLKFAPRVSYTVAYMYDGAYSVWRFRQTGLMLAVPELHGSLFVGRTKEGFSTVRLMVGYNGWTVERSAANDSFLPILADGAKWTATALDNHIVYNVGEFIDALTENQTFNKNNWQVAGRLVWLPLVKTHPDTILHLALEARWGAADDGFLRFKSKPESFIAQSQAVDTDQIPAVGSTMVGAEVYVRTGRFLFGSEYYINQVSSRAANNPFFHGGEGFASYLLGGIRPYNDQNAVFEAVVPTHPVFSGGLGALELVLRYSYVDLDSQAISGGTFSRITPMVSWYLTDNLRLEAESGYSSLHRMDLEGHTFYFQTRLQLLLN